MKININAESIGKQYVSSTGEIVKIVNTDGPAGYLGSDGLLYSANGIADGFNGPVSTLVYCINSDKESEQRITITSQAVEIADIKNAILQMLSTFQNDRNFITDVLHLLSENISIAETGKDVLTVDDICHWIRINKEEDSVAENLDLRKEIDWESVQEWIANNGDAERIFEEIKGDLDIEAIMTEAFDEMSGRGQRQFISDQLSNLSDCDWREVVRNS